MIEYVSLERVLQEGQHYVVQAASKLGIEVKAAKHEIATDTCHEKAQLLGWDDAERVVKALFFYKGEDIYGFIFPELGTEEDPKYLDKKKTLTKLLGVSKNQAKSFHNSYCPEGMEYGTCSPFVLEESFHHDQDKQLKKIFIHDYKSIDEKTVDISIGGKGEDAHKISLHLSYSGIYEILRYKFGNRVEKANLF